MQDCVINRRCVMMVSVHHASKGVTSSNGRAPVSHFKGRGVLRLEEDAGYLRGRLEASAPPVWNADDPAKDGDGMVTARTAIG